MNKKDRALQLVTDRYESARNYWDSFHNKCSTYNKLYKGILDGTTGKKSQTKANVFVPLTFDAIETIVPILIQPYLDYLKSPVSVLPRRIEDEESAKANQSLLSYQTDISGLRQKLEILERHCVKYGMAPGKVYWKTETMRVKEMQEIEEVDDFGNVTLREEEVEYDKVIYDDPCFEPIPIDRFFIDPDADDIQSARFVIERIVNVDPQYLLDMEEQGYYKNVKDIPEVQQYIEADVKSITDEFSRSSATDQPFDEDDYAGIDLLEYWENDRQIIVANENWVIRDEKNMFLHKKKPYVALYYTKLDFEPRGIGIPEAVEGLQIEVNAKRNQRLDNVNLVINPMYLLQEGSIDNVADQMISRPGGVIVCNNIEGIKPLITQDVTSSVYQEISDLRQDFKRVAGNTDELVGTTEVRHRQTRAEIEAKLTQAISRIEYVKTQQAAGALRDIYCFYHWLNQQYMTEERIVRIMGENGNEYRKVTPEDVGKDYDIRITADPGGIQKQLKLDSWLQLLQVMQGNPMFAQMIDMQKILRKTAELFDIDPESILSTPPPMAQGIPPQGMPGMPPQGGQGLPPEMMAMLQGIGGQAPPQGMPPQMLPPEMMGGM